MLTFVFGAARASVIAVPGGLRVAVPCPVIAGDAREDLPFGSGVAETCGEWTVLRAPGMTVFAAVATMDDDSVERVTARLYSGLFERTRELHLYRVWHFVPGILNRDGGREETYRRFCAARAGAFDAAFPAGAEARMPSASAVGADGDRLVIVAVAGEAVPEHFENPEQTPAYRYPPDYGPRPPSFARATRVTTPSGTWTFVSGTAAIRGSESLFPGDFAAQLAVARENLAIMTRLAGPAGAPSTTLRRVYVKPGDAPAGPFAFAGPGRGPVVLRSHICRPELLLEEEVTMHAANPSTL